MWWHIDGLHKIINTQVYSVNIIVLHFNSTTITLYMLCILYYNTVLYNIV